MAYGRVVAVLFVLLAAGGTATAQDTLQGRFPVQELKPWPVYDEVVLSQFDDRFLPRFSFTKTPAVPQLRPAIPFSPRSADAVFYTLAGLFLLVGATTRAFPKYYNDLFRVIARSGFRQKSIRDQLVQNKLASLWLNAIFFLAGGIFVYLVIRNTGFTSAIPWYVQLGICIGFLMTVYGVKYIALKAGGWIFSSAELMSDYAFIIFYVNKIAGLMLLPVVAVLWLGKSSLHPVFFSISFLLLGILFLYRYILVLPVVRKRSGISGFHFLLYLCGFEILPILILVKILVNFLNASV